MLLAIGIATLLAWCAFAGAGIEDMGDGVQHHLFARYLWSHPHLLLDQWAKPLFTLLSSPFARLGYPGGMALFNAVVAVGGIMFALPLSRRGGAFATLLLPVLVLLAPLAAHLIMNGMTEVLFGTMTLIAVSSFHREKYMRGAIIAGLAPLCRPEYIVFLPCVAGWLVIQRRWKELPLLASGIGLYTGLGILINGDPLCWWNGSSYPADSVYGKGSGWQFISQAPDAFGWPVVVLFPIALVLHLRPARLATLDVRTRRLLLITAALPTVGIIAVHAYARATGTHGSAGFARVLVSALPLAAVFSLVTVGAAMVQMERAWQRITAVVAASSLVQLVLFGPLVREPSPDQQALDQACARLLASAEEDATIYATHPYVAFRAGRDPFNEQAFALMWGTENVDRKVKPGDHVVWESQFGPNEFGVPLEHFLTDTGYSVVDVIEPAWGHPVLGGYQYGIWLFRRAPAHRAVITDTLYSLSSSVADVPVRYDTAHCVEVEAWCPESEFPWTVDSIPMPRPGTLYEELVCALKVSYVPGAPGNAALVYKQMDGERTVRYDERWLDEGLDTLVYRVPHPSLPLRSQIYVWVPASVRLRLSGMEITRRRVVQSGL